MAFAAASCRHDPLTGEFAAGEGRTRVFAALDFMPMSAGLVDFFRQLESDALRFRLGARPVFRIGVGAIHIL